MLQLLKDLTEPHPMPPTTGPVTTAGTPYSDAPVNPPVDAPVDAPEDVPVEMFH